MNSRLRARTKAEAAQKAGKFKDEIVPVMIPQRKSDRWRSRATNSSSQGTTLESISGQARVLKDGSVTAANASGLNDGGAAVPVMSASVQRSSARSRQRSRPTHRRASIHQSWGMGPVPASRRCLEKPDGRRQTSI